MINYEVTYGDMMLKLYKYADAQYKTAFEIGTDLAWKKFYKNVNSCIDYWNKQISLHNKEHWHDTLFNQWDLIDKNWFWNHY